MSNVCSGRGFNHARGPAPTAIKPRPPTSNTTTPRTHPQQTTAAPKKDGEKGASAHTVSESHRIQLDTLLLNLRESETETTVTMPADLTNTQRKYVHELAKKLALKSKSYGKGDDRKVVVSKVDNNMKGVMDDDNTPMLDVGPTGIEVLRKHLKRFPPNEAERMESIETGSSLLQQKKENNGVYLMQEAINCLHPTPDVEEKEIEATKARAAKLEHMRKRRVQNHSRAQKAMKSHPQYKKMLMQRKNLPAFGYAQDVCNVLRNKRNQVVILTGDTGCG